MRKLVVFLSYLLPILAYAQTTFIENSDFLIKTFELPDGPSGNSINSVVQGPNGFLWFGGHTGLYRYDGYQIKSYHSDQRDSTTLAYNYIEELFWSSDNYLWIGTWGGGLFRYNPADDSFLRFNNNPDDPNSLSSDRVTVIIEDAEQNLWVGTANGLNHLDRRTGKFEQFRHDPENPSSLSSNHVRSLFTDRQGVLWIGTGFIYDGNNSMGGLNRYNPDTGTFTNYLHRPDDPNSLMGNIIQAIFEDSKGNFWVGGSGGLHKMDRKRGTFERMIDNPYAEKGIFTPGLRKEILDETTVVYAFLEDKAGNLWVFSLHNNPAGVLGSIAIIDTGKNEMELIREREPIIPWEVVQSKDGSIWLAGAGVGGRVHQIIPADSKIKYFPVFGNTEVGLEGMVRDHQGAIWGKTISEDGVVQLIGLDEDLKNYSVRPEPEIKTEFDGDLFSGSGFGLVEDSSHGIWGCTGEWGGGLFRILPRGRETQQFLHDPGNPNSPPSNKIFQILMDRSGQIWMGGENAVSRLDPETGVYTHYKHDPEDAASLNPGNIFPLFEDSSGFIWVRGGSTHHTPFLCRLNPETGEIMKFSFPHDEDGLYSFRGESENSDGDFLVLRPGKGLKLISIDSTNGLSKGGYIVKNLVEGSFLDANNMIIDNDGIFWLTTRTGKIIRFDNEKLSSVEFNNPNNLDIRRGFKLNDGSIYFNYKTGLIKINPGDTSKEEERTNNLQVGFTELRLNGQAVSASVGDILKVPIWMEKEIRLPHNQRNVSIRFSVFDLKNPLNNQYEVRLLPLEDSWQLIQGDPMVNYFQMPPGNYTLEVRGSDSNGVWTEKTSKLGISIAPPWYRSWWAYILYGLALAMIAYRYHRFQKARTIYQEREKMREKELAHAREIEKAYTELKSTQQQLIHSEKMASLGELTAGIAHEIQNPLNFVNNFSEVSRELIEELKEEKTGAKKVHDHALELELLADIDKNLEKIHHHGKRADNIVKGMLKHSRGTIGKKEPTDLNALADEYFRLGYHGLRARDKSFNAKMETEFDPELPAANVVPQDIGRVLLNLITNAFQAVSERKKKEPKGYEPTVWIKTRKTTDGMEISVRDNGGGIPQNIRDKIFQPFFTTKPTGQGTGLGLSMSYDIVTKGHQGILKVESEEGVGAEFFVTLPV
jgi:signal transduction histidine kinase/ligand-binding sensor domain-containing protein